MKSLKVAMIGDFFMRNYNSSLEVRRFRGLGYEMMTSDAPMEEDRRFWSPNSVRKKAQLHEIFERTDETRRSASICEQTRPRSLPATGDSMRFATPLDDSWTGLITRSDTKRNPTL